MFKKSDFCFLISALIAFAFANYLWLSGYKAEGAFVSLWVPSNLMLGLYFRNISTTVSKK